MKIMRTTPNGSEPVMVFLERKYNTAYIHSIDKAFRLCSLPSIVKRVIATKANKNYNVSSDLSCIEMIRHY